MMKSLALLAFASPLFPFATASLTVDTRQTGQRCIAEDQIKTLWVVDKLNVHYTGDETVRPGNATFTLTHADKKVTEDIKCSLRANYVCEIYGTPADAQLHIWLQLNLNVGTFTLNRTLSDCLGEGKNAYILGTAEMYLECPQQYIDEDEGMVCEDDGIAGPADGHVVVPEAQQGLTERDEQASASTLTGREPAKTEEDVAAPRPVGRQTEKRKTRPVEPAHYEEV